MATGRKGVLLDLDHDDHQPVDIDPVQVRDDPGFAVLTDAVGPFLQGFVRDGASHGPALVGDPDQHGPSQGVREGPDGLDRLIAEALLELDRCRLSPGNQLPELFGGGHAFDLILFLIHDVSSLP